MKYIINNIGKLLRKLIIYQLIYQFVNISSVVILHQINISAFLYNYLRDIYKTNRLILSEF